MPVGRLDHDSEGLLLMTTNGQLSYQILAEGQVAKEYFALVEGEPSLSSLEQLAEGVALTHRRDKYIAQASDVRRVSHARVHFPPRRQRTRDYRKTRDGTIISIPTTWLSLTVRHGRFHMVRKMTAAIGHPTLRLVRVRIGTVTLGDMAPGDVRPWDGQV